MFIYQIAKFFISLVMPFYKPILDLGEFVILWDWIPEFLDSIKICFYLLPVYDLIPLIRLVVLLGILRILIALVRFVFDAIPLY